ncbi:MAG: ribosome maturation factor RimP [Desulfomonilaceae bacterium]
MVTNRKLLSDLWTMIEPVLEPDGIELVEVEYLLLGGSWTLRLYIDTPNGVTIDDCAMVSRQIGALLDMENPIDHRYNLEVSSPGINRVIRKLQDFERFSGRQARIKTTHKIDGRKNFSGMLKGTLNTTVLMELENRVVEIDVENIEKAHLETPPDEILQQDLHKNSFSVGG